MTARASIVVPVWNEVAVTLRCLEALIASTPEGLFHLVVVDNASTDATPQLLASLEGDVTVITNDTNVGYTLASNQGAAATDHEVVIFLNNDTEPQPGWLEALLECFDRHPEAAIVGSKLVYPDGRLQEAGGLVFDDATGWNFGRFGHPDHPRFTTGCEVDYCSGAALAVRRSFLDQVGGGYDPRYAPAYYEDTDLCFAARAEGWTVRYEPASVVVHHEGITAGTDVASGYKRYQVVNREKFAEKWSDVLGRQGPSPQRSGLVLTTQDRLRRPCGVATAPVPGERRPGPPRVFVVDPFMPMHDRASGSLRLFRILESMRRGGCEVLFLARNGAGQERYEADLEALGVRCLRSDRHRLRELGADDPTAPFAELDAELERFDPDLAWLGFHDVALSYLPLVRRWSPRTPVWVDSVDVHHVRKRRQAELAEQVGNPEAPQLAAGADLTRALEEWVYGLADGLIAVTDDDARELSVLAPGVPVAIVPNIHPLTPAAAPLDERNDILFVGNFAHPPNVDAVEWLCTDVMPAVRRRVPGARCRVVGGGAPESLVRLMAMTPNVTALGWVADLASELDTARVSLAPLRYGAGMKGKVGEALAAGLPVVTTAIGAEGMGLVDGEHLLVADDADAIAEAVAGLLVDDGQWHRLSAAGRRAIEQRFAPEVVARAVGDVLQQAVPVSG
ncbi:MAG: glycosyltransferase [Acidimicrobiales bacterium]